MGLLYRTQMLDVLRTLYLIVTYPVRQPLLALFVRRDAIHVLSHPTVKVGVLLTTNPEQFLLNHITSL